MNVQLDLRMEKPEFLIWVQAHEGRYELAGNRVVMMTGGYPTAALLSQLASARIPLLIKPFSLDMLVEHIRRVAVHERVLGAA